MKGQADYNSKFEIRNELRREFRNISCINKELTFLKKVIE